MNQAVIVEAKRTPIGKKDGVFKNIRPEELAAAVMRDIVAECQLDAKDIDDVILGNAVGPGGNLARLSALTAGFPFSVPGMTVDRQCGSGLEAVNLAARLVQAGAGDIYLAGGVESASLAPLKIESSASEQKSHTFSRARFSPEAIGDPEMGEAAENVAEKYHVTREQQDNFALHSYQKAIHSMKKGTFADEIVPVQGVFHDESPDEQTNYQKLLPRLRPAFRTHGTVTAGNACAVNDGAAVVLVMSAKKAQVLGLQPKLIFVDTFAAGVDPNVLGIGPVPAVKKLLQRKNLTVADLDLVEFNEAFAAQVIASLRELHIPSHLVNVGGGAIAFGHPFGASGAILVTRLCTELTSRDVKRGVATLGIGGGIGVATLFERMTKDD